MMAGYLIFLLISLMPDVLMRPRVISNHRRITKMAHASTRVARILQQLTMSIGRVVMMAHVNIMGIMAVPIFMHAITIHLPFRMMAVVLIRAACISMHAIIMIGQVATMAHAPTLDAPTLLH